MAPKHGTRISFFLMFSAKYFSIVNCVCACLPFYICKMLKLYAQHFRCEFRCTTWIMYANLDSCYSFKSIFLKVLKRNVSLRCRMASLSSFKLERASLSLFLVHKIETTCELSLENRNLNKIKMSCQNYQKTLSKSMLARWVFKNKQTNKKHIAAYAFLTKHFSCSSSFSSSACCAAKEN